MDLTMTAQADVLAPAMPVDAQDLMAWIRNRDEAAFASLVQRHTAMVAAVCRRRLSGGGADPDEAAQAVFIVLARRASSAAAASSLGGWLHGVAIQVCRNAQRAAGRRLHHERIAASQGPGLGNSGPPWNEFSALLDQAVASLDAGLRDIVVGHFLAGRTQAAVAADLGISEDAARKRAATALTRLRDWFGRRGLIIGSGALASGLSGEAVAAESSLVAACTQAALQPGNAVGALALAKGVAVAAGVAWSIAIAAAVLAVAGGVAVMRLAMVPPPAPRAAVAEAPPPVAAAQPGPHLSRQLDLPVAARFRRDYLAEIAADLERQTGVDIVFPPGIARAAMLSFEAEPIPLRTALERIAAAGDMTLAWAGDLAVFWKPVDDARLAGMAAGLRGDQAARLAAVFDLSRLADPRIYPHLFTALADPDPAVGNLAVRCLLDHPLSAQTVAPQPIAALTRWLRDPLASDYAAHALGRTRDPRAVDALLSLATSDDPQLRHAAAEGLGWSGDHRAAEALIALAANPEPTVRGTALMSLGSLHDPRAIPALITAARAGRSDDRLAIMSLCRMHDQRADEFLLGELGPNASSMHATPQALPDLLRLARDGRGQRRQAAIAILGNSRDKRAADRLIELVQEQVAPAARALGQTRDARAVATLAPLVEDPLLGKSVLDGLAESRDLHAGDIVVQRQQGPVPEDAIEGFLRCLAVRTEDANRLLIERCSDPERLWSWAPALPGAGIPGLTMLDPWFIPRLEELSAKPFDFASEALSQLACSGDARIAPFLVAAAQHGDPRMRRSAARAMACDQMRVSAGGTRPAIDPRRVDALIRLAGDADLDVRKEVASSLLRIRDARLAPPLVALLNDPDHELRSDLAKSLTEAPFQRFARLPSVAAALKPVY